MLPLLRRRRLLLRLRAAPEDEGSVVLVVLVLVLGHGRGGDAPPETHDFLALVNPRLELAHVLGLERRLVLGVLQRKGIAHLVRQQQRQVFRRKGRHGLRSSGFDESGWGGKRGLGTGGRAFYFSASSRSLSPFAQRVSW